MRPVKRPSRASTSSPTSAAGTSWPTFRRSVTARSTTKTWRRFPSRAARCPRTRCPCSRLPTRGRDPSGACRPRSSRWRAPRRCLLGPARRLRVRRDIRARGRRAVGRRDRQLDRGGGDRPCDRVGLLHGHRDDDLGAAADLAGERRAARLRARDHRRYWIPSTSTTLSCRSRASEAFARATAASSFLHRRCAPRCGCAPSRFRRC